MSLRPEAFVTSAFLCLWAVLAAAEALCGRLAYFTIDEVTSLAVLVFVALANLIPLALFFLGKLRFSALMVSLLIALAVVPYNLRLGWRWVELQEEAGDLIGWLHEQKLSTGHYPPTLAGYRFHRPDLRRYFEAYRADKDGIYLEYYVGSKNSPHMYAGRWDYTPD